MNPELESCGVTLCKDIPGMNKCPRCLRWTKNDGPAYPCSNGDAGVICWRCQYVLASDATDHEAGIAVIQWRTERGLPLT